MTDAQTLEVSVERDPVTGEVYINHAELARALGITEPTLDRWIARGCPCVERGSKGRGSKFLLSEVKLWRANELAVEQAVLDEKQAAVRQEQLDLAGGRPGDSPMAYGPRERLVLWQEELTYQKAALARGELIPAEVVQDAITQLFRSVAAFLQALPDRVGRECGLTPLVGGIKLLARRAFHQPLCEGRPAASVTYRRCGD